MNMFQLMFKFDENCYNSINEAKVKASKKIIEEEKRKVS